MVDLELYRLFVTVANEGNITRASEILHISQPAISKQIHNLEYELNTKLFERSNTGVKLTIDGIDYVVDSNNLIHDEQNGCYRFTYNIDFEPTTVNASYLGFPAIYDYVLVSEYLTIKGNKYTTITINFL